jgi:hypothetical protein
MNTRQLLMEQLMESITKRNGEIYTLPITRKGESLRPKLDIRDPRSPIKISKKTLNRYDTALNALQQSKPDTIQRGRADEKYRKVIKNIGSKERFRGIYRGKIKRASDTLTYHFKPSGVISSGNRANPELHYYPQLGQHYTEAGEHVYSFTTPHGSEGKISMSHGTTGRKSSERRNGHMTKTEIQFDVDSSKAKTGRQGNKAVGIFRNVLAAIKHHSKSHDPDVVTFSASEDLFGPRNTRVKLYKYLTTKMNKVVGNKYRVSHHEDRQTGQSPGDGPLNFTLERKKISDRTARSFIAQLDANREEARKIAKGKITKPINTKEKKEKTK